MLSVCCVVYYFVDVVVIFGCIVGCIGVVVGAIVVGVGIADVVIAIFCVAVVVRCVSDVDCVESVRFVVDDVVVTVYGVVCLLMPLFLLRWSGVWCCLAFL